MLLVPASLAASAPVSLAMLLGGLVILVAGLALLTRGLPVVGLARPDEPARVLAMEPPCDWAAYLEDDVGGRTILRPAEGRECCVYILHIRDLDGTADTDELEERLSWSGDATRIGPDGAVTPLLRDVVTRRTVPSAAGVAATLSLEGSPGPHVSTPGWQDLPLAAFSAAYPHESRTGQLWNLHLDALRQHGARPASDGGSSVFRLAYQRRIEVSVQATRGCRPVDHGSSIEGRCRAELQTTATRTPAPLGVPLLGSWIATDGLRVVASTLTTPPIGIDSWQLVESDAAAGVSATCEPDASTGRAAWTGEGSAMIPQPPLTVTMGSAVELEASPVARVEGTAAVEVDVRTMGRLRLQIGASREATRKSKGTEAPRPARDAGLCHTCVPFIDLTLGSVDPGARAGSEPGSTSDGEIRLDAHHIQLQRPRPGDSANSWTVIEADTDGDRLTGRAVPREVI